MLLNQFVFVLLLTVCDGFDFGCTNTDVLYTNEKNTVTFFADFTLMHFHMITFYNTTKETREIFSAFVDTHLLGKMEIDILSIDASLKNRTYVFGKRKTYYQMSISIALKNIVKSDNGTYALDIEGRYKYCWKLFVLDIEQQHKDGLIIVEGSTAMFIGYPQVSLVKTQALNATLTWSLHGRYKNQTTLFDVKDDMMIIPLVSRDMDGWNITYKCVDVSGAEIELNKTLKVMYIKVYKETHLIQEGEAVFVEGYPPRQTTGLTFEWLFDGYNLTQISEYQFVEQENKLWILFAARNMDGKNVTYRTTDSNDVITEVNSTVRIAYGPNWPVHLLPSRKTYKVRTGDIVPDITCYVDCNPPCNLSWDIDGEGNILKLKQLTMETRGEYTCTAKRIGTSNSINETIYVYVQEDAPSPSTAPIAVTMLASFQALSVICIGCLVVYILQKGKQRICKLCFKSPSAKKENREGSGGKSQYDNLPMSTLGSEAYEDLRAETRDVQMENYSNVEIGEVYVNTGY